MSRIFNFSAGPSTLPEAVLLKAQEELLDFNGSGMSVMEISHRGKAFMSVADALRSDLIELLNIPDNYKVCFYKEARQVSFLLFHRIF
jgi:phosphoserine aminotransferase apoenzyme (EC 2.6.1.52)